jgi:hypothetical protein
MATEAIMAHLGDITVDHLATEIAGAIVGVTYDVLQAATSSLAFNKGILRGPLVVC